MNTKNLFIGISFFLFFSIHALKAQEVITDLRDNSVLFDQFNKQYHNKSNERKTSLKDTIDLPFLDDFSQGAYASNQRWLDSNVYINNNYPLNPPSIGVATFDGLNKQGIPYQANTPTAHGKADSLTSRYINLFTYVDPQTQITHQYSAADSVYLSFFYESRGLGNAPEDEDSLVLQFKVPNDTLWHTIKQFVYAGNDSTFKQALIRVDTMYMKKGFQFRFINYATLSGNLDHWHIDYVKLNRARSMNDTIIDDAAFVKNTHTLLKNYTAMPWWQFNNAEQATTINSNIQDNSNVAKNINYKYVLYNGYNQPLDSVESQPLVASHENHFQSAPFNYQLPLATTTRSYNEFKLRNTITTNPDVNHHNDTTRFVQPLYNFYSYDDGSAENGYGLNVAEAELAVEFQLNKPDTLSAVSMHFEHLIYDYSQRAIHILVWKDLNADPINEPNTVNPQYGGFYHYKIPPLPVSGTIYIGWMQESADILNVGFDRNTDASSHVHYKIDGTGWKTSLIKGSVMIRPVFGDPDFVGINEINTKDPDNITLYPNPCNDHLFISINLQKPYEYFIINTLGQIVKQGVTVQQEINISALPEGFYFLKIISSALSKPFDSKFIINR